MTPKTIMICSNGQTSTGSGSLVSDCRLVVTFPCICGQFVVHASARDGPKKGMPDIWDVTACWEYDQS